MRAPSVLLAATLAAASAAAIADAGANSAPDSPETIHVNAMRNPEVRSYAAIVAGMDEFERHHALAPGVDALRFQIRALRLREGLPEPARVGVQLEGEDGFRLPLVPGPKGELLVPRSRAALKANSELMLNQKRRDYRIEPLIRTPGLPENLRRLGDLRLECKVMVAIAKEEIGTFWTLTVNSLLLTRDWCSFDKASHDGFSFRTAHTVTGAVLQDGNLSRNLRFSDKSFQVPLYDQRWSDDALIELQFAAPPELTGTAGETPRTDS